MKWLIELLLRGKRLQGLDETQLQDLIRNVDDVEALKLIKQHLEIGNFKYPHLKGMAPGLIQQCISCAKKLTWLQHAETVKRAFLENRGDLL